MPFDATTIAVYDAYANEYAARPVPKSSWNALKFFCAKLAPGARVLDLGCGAGWASEEMQRRGFDVHSLDASSKLAALASPKLRRPVMVKTFDAVGSDMQFDGVFACHALPHVPKDKVPTILSIIASAMRENAVLYACFPSGDGDMRDRLGRYYAMYQAEEVLALFERQPSLKFSSLRTESIEDDFGSPQILFGVFARKTSSKSH
ncbi:MAG: methyltransferase domain-containing protein [Hyphomicrobiales bacterium]|nr:methyltransferase domain-containing protein [Hyphomicrobiales bacterium]